MTSDFMRELAALAVRPDISVLLKVTLAFLLGLAAIRLLSRARASVRHLLAAATFAAAVAIPLLEPAVPAITIEVPASRYELALPAGFPTPSAGTAAVAARDVDSVDGAAPADSAWSIATSLRAVWLAGVVFGLSVLALDLRKLRRLRRESIPSLELRPLIQELAGRNGIGRPVDILLHEGIPAPLVCGLAHPAIVLPAEALGWKRDDLVRALTHELEHVGRADWPVQILARAICALYWFHPLVWGAWRTLCLEAERACDDAVLQSAQPDDYASQLVSLARRQSSATAGAMLGMANRSDLSARVAAMLNTGQRRGPAGLRAAGCAIALAALVVAAIAPIRAVAQRGAGETVFQARSLPAATTASPFAEALYEAASEGDLSEIDDLLARGAEVNAVIRGDGSPLIGAARHGHLEAARRLLDRGADPNLPVSGDGSPLIVAASGGHAAIVSLLLDRGADPNMPVLGDGNPLIMAAAEGHVGIVKTLLERGARIEEVVPGDENALIWASAAGQLEAVQFLVSRGADVHARVWAARGRSDGEVVEGEWRTPLNMAQRNGHDHVVEYLRAAGARE